MKTLSAVLFLSMISMNAFAALTPVSSSDLDSYKQGVIVAFEGGQFNCKIESGTITGYLGEMIDDSTSAQIDVDGQQPLLVFTKEVNGERRVVTIQTSGDYKKIKSARVENSVLKKKNVNQGDLRKPHIVVVASYETTAAASCSAIEE